MFSRLRNFIHRQNLRTASFLNPYIQSIVEPYTFVNGYIKTVVNLHRDVSAEVLADKLKHRLAAVLVRFLKTGAFVEDLADP